MNLVLLLLALNALPVSSDTQAPVVTMRKPYCDCANTFARVVEEDVKWSEPPVLKGNSTEDRLRHDPE